MPFLLHRDVREKVAKGFVQHVWARLMRGTRKKFCRDSAQEQEDALKVGLRCGLSSSRRKIFFFIFFFNSIFEKIMFLRIRI